MASVSGVVGVLLLAITALMFNDGILSWLYPPLSFSELRALALEAGLQPVPIPRTGQEATFREGKPWEGTFVWSSHKTEVIVETYMGGLRHGSSVGYHSEDRKHWEGNYVNGKKDGVFRSWGFSGRPHTTETYQDGVLVPKTAVEAAAGE